MRTKEPLWFAAAPFLLMSVSWGAFAGQARSEISLNGDWLVQKVSDLSVVPKGDWQPLRVPGYLTGTQYERAWLKRTFQAGADWTGQRNSCFPPLFIWQWHRPRIR